MSYVAMGELKRDPFIIYPTKAHCRDLLDEYGVKLRVLGKTHMLPADVQEAVRKAEYMTQHNNKSVTCCIIDISKLMADIRAILNLCMPYTARDEIVTAIQSTVRNSLHDENNIQ